MSGFTQLLGMSRPRTPPKRVEPRAETGYRQPLSNKSGATAVPDIMAETQQGAAAAQITLLERVNRRYAMTITGLLLVIIVLGAGLGSLGFTKNYTDFYLLHDGAGPIEEWRLERYRPSLSDTNAILENFSAKYVQMREEIVAYRPLMDRAWRATATPAGDVRDSILQTMTDPDLWTAMSSEKARWLQDERRIVQARMERRVDNGPYCHTAEHPGVIDCMFDLVDRQLDGREAHRAKFYAHLVLRRRTDKEPPTMYQREDNPMGFLVMNYSIEQRQVAPQ